MKKYSPAEQALRIARNTFAGGGEAAKKVAKAIKAYHGSPHSFDRFSLDKVGTGEGAQAYGHGLYFAENEGVARGYRDALSRAPITGNAGTDLANYSVSAARGDTGKAIRSLEQEIAGYEKRGWPSADYRQQYDEAISALREGRAQPSGHMYEVNIDAHPEQLLNWNKQLKEQPEGVVRSLQDRGLINMDENIGPSSVGVIRSLGWTEDVGRLSGEKLYRRLIENQLAGFDRKGAEALASKELASAGVPGIKYLDAGSRGNNRWEAVHPRGGINDFADEASAQAFIARNPEYSLTPPKVNHNYVIFDDKIIDIARKYGIGLPAAAALYQTMNPDGGQAQAAETAAPAAAPTNASQASGWNAGPSTPTSGTGTGAVSRQLSNWAEQTASDVGDVAKYVYNNPGQTYDMAKQAAVDAAKWTYNNPSAAAGKALEMVASGIPKFVPSGLWGPSGLLNPDAANAGEDTDALIARLKAKQSEQGQPDQSYRARAPSGVMNPLTAGATLGLGAAMVAPRGIYDDFGRPLAASAPDIAPAAAISSTSFANPNSLTASSVAPSMSMAPASFAPAERPVSQPPRRPADLAPAPQRAPPDWGDNDSPAAFFRADKKLQSRMAAGEDFGFPRGFARGGMPTAHEQALHKAMHVIHHLLGVR